MIEIVIIIILILFVVADWKFNVPSTILWGAAGIIVYIGFVYNEMGKGKPFNEAIWTFPIIGIAGLILLIVGLFINFKKLKNK